MLGIRQWNLFPYINRNLIAIRAHIFNNSRLLITDFLKAINSSLSDMVTKKMQIAHQKHLALEIVQKKNVYFKNILNISCKLT